MSRSVTNRILKLERSRAAFLAEIIPPDQRWWCALCETDAERAACLSEPATWKDLHGDWNATLDELTALVGGWVAVGRAGAGALENAPENPWQNICAFQDVLPPKSTYVLP